MTSSRKTKPRPNPNRPISPKGTKSLSRSPGRTPNPYPTEDDEQKALAQWLNARFGYYGWVHVANQQKAKPGYVGLLKALGMKGGFPDILIFKPERWCNGMAIELKRQKGGSMTQCQKDWLAAFAGWGWAATVAYGAKDAINKIKEVYGKE